MGASSGIGRATALRFAEQGAKVVVAARGEPGLKSLVAEIEAAGGTATAVVADVTDPAQVPGRRRPRRRHEYGRLDTWVHMAGVLLVAGFDDTTPEEFARVLQVNLLGQVHGAKAALPHLRRDGGAFISMSSMGSQRGIPLQTAYCSSKHGIDGFLEALRVELQRDGVPVSVTQIMPGTINTPLFDNARTKMGVKPVAPPPAYPARVVADAIVHAAAHPVRDLVVGGAAKTLITVEKFAPRARRRAAAPGRLRDPRHRRAQAGRRAGQPRRPAHRQRHRRGHRRRRDPAPQRLHLVGDAQTRPQHGPHAHPTAHRPSHRVVARRRRRDRRRAPRCPAHRRGTLTGGLPVRRQGHVRPRPCRRRGRGRTGRSRERAVAGADVATIADQSLERLGGGPASWPASGPTMLGWTG